MKKIAVISAFPNNNNPGMISSDLAFPYFCKKYLTDSFEFDRFCIETDLVLNSESRGDELEYQKLSDPNSELSKYDLIFFWGDFLHSKNYMDSVAKRIKRNNPDLTIKDIENHVYRTLLFDGVDKIIINKTILFGSVIFTNQKDHKSEKYKNSLKNLYNNCAFYSHRDPLSQFIASNYSDNSNSCAGVDCAFYLNNEINDTRPIPNRTVGYSFGRRTKGKWRKRLIKIFVYYISKSEKIDNLINIDWLNNDVQNPVDFTFEKIELLKKCDFIITDTYHCAVNSWRIGVPAFCIGVGGSRLFNATNDKKKELLYGMFQALPFYIFIEEIQDILKWKKIKNQIYDLAANDKYIRNIRERMKNAMDRVGYELKKNIHNKID